MDGSDFHLPTGTYLLSHSVGLPPKQAQTALAQGYFAAWTETPANAWDHWLARIEHFRSLLAGLLGGDAGSYCPQPNLSAALTKILYGLPNPEQRRGLVLTEAAFPSIGFVFSRAQQAGLQTRFIPNDRDASDLTHWFEAFGGDPLLVLITHVHSNTSQRLPVQEIVALARDAGATTVVDIAQSAGVVPIDVEAWGADFVIGSCVKWLCGGPGAGFLWVNPDRVDDCQPVDVGWFSHAEPFEFDIHQFRYADDALRFWGGTPSVAPYVIASHSIERLTALGIDAVHQHNQRLTQRLVDQLDDHQLASPRDPQQRGGTVLVRSAEQFFAALNQADIHHDTREGAARLSPHLYNSEVDIDKVIELLS